VKARLSGLRSTNHSFLAKRTRVLRDLQAQVRDLLGPEPRAIQLYAKSFEKEFKKAWKTSDKKELLQKLAQTDIAYGADFHAFPQVQRTHLKILRALPRNRPVALALEAFSVSAQDSLDAFIHGKIDEAELLRASHWESNWGFPWENYRPLLELARTRKYRVLALGPAQNHPKKNLKIIGRRGESLSSQDRRVAKRILADRKQNPAYFYYVIFGELHLAGDHLPAQVKTMAKSEKIKDLVIYVNSERIYFQLAKRGLEGQIEIVRLSGNQFCILSSPPWIQWQSYVLFLQKSTGQDPQLIVDENSAEGETESDQLVELIEILESDLGVQFRHDDIAAYRAQDGRQNRKIEKAIAGYLTQTEMKIARKLMLSGRSFYLPRGGLFYVSKSHINQISELAGRYVHAKLCAQSKLPWQMPHDWPALIWTEAVAFFMSKLINHKRASHTLTDLRSELVELTRSQDNSKSDADGNREVLMLALDQRLIELMQVHQGRRSLQHFRPVQKMSYFESARILGSMLGERLYLVWRSRKISVRTLRNWFKQDLQSPDFVEFYDDVVRRLEPVAKKVKTKRERL
jgi:hypothetical protein